MHPAAVAGMGHRRAIARVSVSALVASLPLLYVSLLRPPPAALAGDTAFWFLMSNCIVAAIVATSDGAAHDDPCDDGLGGDGLSCASAGQLPLAVQGIISDAVDHALPSSIEGEGEDAATECSAEIEIEPPVQKGEEEEEQGIIVVEPSTVKNNTVKVKAQGEDDREVVPVATIEEGSAISEPEPEPWSKQEGAADGEWPVALDSPPPVAPAAQYKGVAATREADLRRSETVGSNSKEYWLLSDEELNRRVEDFIARFNREMRLQVEQEARV
ncbi:unnamed protein product [Urochloa decumbens]|uniref:Uncharacterized protein n=1 Tax=Urochloa decumbens TaxID=240449 RepID=A0ABC9HE59_9POAL